MTELTVRVEQTKLNVFGDIQDLYARERFYNKVVVVFRVVVSFICASTLVFWTVCCIVVNTKDESKADPIERRLQLSYTAVKVYGDGFLLVGILLGVSIAILFWRLKAKQS